MSWRWKWVKPIDRNRRLATPLHVVYCRLVSFSICRMCIRLTKLHANFLLQGLIRFKECLSDEWYGCGPARKSVICLWFNSSYVICSRFFSVVTRSFCYCCYKSVISQDQRFVCRFFFLLPSAIGISRASPVWCLGKNEWSRLPELLFNVIFITLYLWRVLCFVKIPQRPARHKKCYVSAGVNNKYLA